MRHECFSFLLHRGVKFGRFFKRRLRTRFEVHDRAAAVVGPKQLVFAQIADPRARSRRIQRMAHVDATVQVGDDHAWTVCARP
jgi:hypothetical protein